MVESEQEGMAPAFMADVGIPTMTVTGSVGESWDDLDRAKSTPKKDKPQVVPLVRVIHGLVQNVTMSIVPPAKLLENKKLFVMEMKKVFHAATTESMTFVEDFSEFVFKEGSLKSDWVSASKLKLKFWKSYGDKKEERVELSSAERLALEGKDFMVRIHLSPDKDPSKFWINWVAIPIEEQNFKKITDVKVAKHGEGYPVLSLCSYVVDVGVKPPRGTGRFGLPGVPVLIRDQDDEEMPSDYDIIYAVRLVVAESEQLNFVPPETWHTMNDNQEMVVIPGRHEHAWPRVQEIQTEPTESEKEVSESPADESEEEMESVASLRMKEYRQKVLERKEKEKKKAEEAAKRKPSEKEPVCRKSQRLQPGRKAKEQPKTPSKAATKKAGGASKANSQAVVKKKLQAAKEKLKKKTGEVEAKKKGRQRMRELALERDTEEESDQPKKKMPRKSSLKAKSVPEVSWKEPVSDFYSSLGEEEGSDEVEGEDSDHNTTFNESPEETESDEEVVEVSSAKEDESEDSSSDEEGTGGGKRGGRQLRKKRSMPLSKMIPKALWPRGMSSEAIDNLDMEQLESLQKHDIEIRKLEGATEGKNPGKLVEETALTMSKVFVKSAYHDYVSKFSRGQFLHPPLGPPKRWWKYVAVEYTEVTAEYGAEERGVTGRIAHSTWVSAHNRKWIGELAFWSSQNIYSSKLKKQSTLRMVRNEFRITTSDNDSFAELKTVQEAWECMNNYRSAWTRLWPFDWTPEAMFKVLEDFQWGILVQKVPNGLVLRLRIISEWCKKIWSLNARNWSEPPLKYLDMKKLWVEFMTAHNIVEYTPGQATNFVDNTLGQFSSKDDKNRSKKEEREDAERSRDRDRRRDRFNRDRNDNRRGRGYDRDRDRNNRDRSRSRFREAEVGRFPADWKKAIDAKGNDLCISFQLGNCKKSEKDCPDKRVHRCATVTEKTEPLTLCLKDHAAKDCEKRKK